MSGDVEEATVVQIDQLAGSWTLQCIEIKRHGKLVTTARRRVFGMLVYSLDEHVSVLVALPMFPFGPRRCFAYAGTVSCGVGEVTHDVTIGTRPFQGGTRQRRAVRLAGGDHPTLALDAPLGHGLTMTLVWRPSRMVVD